MDTSGAPAAEESVAAKSGLSSAEDFRLTIRSLLESQRFAEARQAAARAAGLFPDHPWLRQADRVLNPSGVTVVPARDRDTDRRKEYDWLRRHQAEYRGRWVALLGDELIACSDSFDEVLGAVRARELKARPLVHRVE